MGRRPLPSHLKLIKGTARGALKKKKADAVEFPTSQPMPPAHLCDDAKTEWGRIAPQLFALRLLTNADIAALMAYCQAWATFKQATEARQVMAKADPLTKALMIKTTNGNAIQNPLLGIANKAASDMVRFASEFGMTPVARARIHAAKENPDDAPGEKYFA